MNEVINNNKYKLKYWLAMLYIHGRKFMIGSVFNYQRLSKDFILCYFIKIWVPIFVRSKAVTDLKNALHYPLRQIISLILTACTDKQLGFSNYGFFSLKLLVKNSKEV